MSQRSYSPRGTCISIMVAGVVRWPPIGEWNVGWGMTLCMWLTFCCLHSLQAFRLPPRRLPVTGGVFSISTESGLLCMKSTPGCGRGSWGDRKSLGGIRCGPFGASRFRYSRSIRIGLRLPNIKLQRIRSRELVGFHLPEIGEIDCLKGG